MTLLKRQEFSILKKVSESSKTYKCVKDSEIA